MRPFVALMITALPVALAAAGCKRESAPGFDQDATVPHDARPNDAALADGSLSDGGHAPCDGLDLPACRLRGSCAPDLCFTCSCTPTFEGCRVASDPPFQCPEVACEQPLCCESMTDCQNMGGDCAPPGAPYGCGMCNPETGDCSADGDCALGYLCEPINCSCDSASHCVLGCAAATDCPLGTTCSGGDHPRCQPSACSSVAPCPPDFDCDSGTCVRRPCLIDLHCDHFCVLGLCYEGQGECRQPVP